MPQSSLAHIQIQNPSTLFLSPKALISLSLHFITLCISCILIQQSECQVVPLIWYFPSLQISFVRAYGSLVRSPIIWSVSLRFVLSEAGVHTGRTQEPFS